MNSIVNLLESENLSLEKDYGARTYTYHVSKKMITYPAFDDLTQPESIFSLAHELGHHYQNKHYNLTFNLFSSLSRKKHLLSWIFFPFLLWEEIDAWIHAWKICRKEYISVDGFISCMLKGLKTYVGLFFSQMIGVLKFVLGLYLFCVFWIRFLIISEEMSLQQPEWLQQLRQMVVNATQSQSEIISEMFYAFLTLYIFLMLFYLVGQVLIELSKRGFNI